MKKIMMLYVPCPSREEAKSIAKILLEKSLIVCANIFPITSIYKWEGEVVDDSEYVLFLKTFDGSIEKLKEKIKKIHPYEVPCIIKLDLEVNEEYFSWMQKTI
jgi:periplasmic divalent cation tolerance protein